jgi:poly(hydroxyalkanoate) depolymerase family esterase
MAVQPNRLTRVKGRNPAPGIKGLTDSPAKDSYVKRMFSAAMRRANRLMRPVKSGKARRAFGKAMTGMMMEAAFAPLAALAPALPKAKTPRKRKTAGPLGAVLGQLRAAQARMPRAAAQGAALQLAEGAQFLARTHRTPAASRDYKIYMPAGAAPRGLILMLHGCNQTVDDFAAGTHINAQAEKHGLLVVYPSQTTADNAAACWNWFKPGHQARGAGEPAFLASLTRKLMKQHGLGRDAVFVAGLSAGGAMAAILADVYPDVFSAAGIHSGLARGAAGDVLGAMSAMRSGGVVGPDQRAAEGGPRTRRIVFHGDADTTVHPSNAAMIVAAALGDDPAPSRITKRSVRGRGYVRRDYAGPGGPVLLEWWMLEGAGHAWSGGRAAGSYTDPAGPDASAQMVRFFLGNKVA